MDEETVKAFEDFRLWFANHLRNPCFFVAQRAALRVLNLSNLEAHSGGSKLVLLLHRAIMTAECVARFGSRVDLQSQLSVAQQINAAAFVDQKIGSETALMASDAILKAGVVQRTIEFQFPALRSIEIAFMSIEDRGPLAVSAFIESVQADMQAEQLPRTNRAIFEERPLQTINNALTYAGLLPLEGNPERAEKMLGSSFWRRWWGGVLSGQQINWDLQQAVALIPDDDWQKGPEHIAIIIARLEEQFDLRSQIADLAEKLREVQALTHLQAASEFHRGHNHPPELIGKRVAVRQEIAAALVELDEAHVELAKHSPSIAALHRIGTVLWRISKNIAIYCGGLADIAAKKAAEVVGETGTKAFIWTVAAHYAQMDSVAKSLLEFAAKLAAGG